MSKFNKGDLICITSGFIDPFVPRLFRVVENDNAISVFNNVSYFYHIIPAVLADHEQILKEIKTFENKMKHLQDDLRESKEYLGKLKSFLKSHRKI